jgi:hypothetical protein
MTLPKTRTVYLVEWKDLNNKWFNKKFHTNFEATAFCSTIESARTIILRENQEIL